MGPEARYPPLPLSREPPHSAEMRRLKTTSPVIEVLPVRCICMRFSKGKTMNHLVFLFSAGKYHCQDTWLLLITLALLFAAKQCSAGRVCLAADVITEVLIAPLVAWFRNGSSKFWRGAQLAFTFSVFLCCKPLKCLLVNFFLLGSQD